MMGVFVQLNVASERSKSVPVGYVIQENGCWDFVGAMRHGYGALFCRRGVVGQAHRVVYEAIYGPVKPGLHLDHLCRNTACVNPDHMEPVSPRTNVLRGTGWTSKNARKTHCPYGHPFSGTNLAITKDGRKCRACDRDRQRVKRKAQREQQAA